jgi:hypothetical protein
MVVRCRPLISAGSRPQRGPRWGTWRARPASATLLGAWQRSPARAMGESGPRSPRASLAGAQEGVSLFWTGRAYVLSGWNRVIRAGVRMNSVNLAGLSTAIIAGLVALTGYLLNQFANRRERKSKVYAEALEAIREYQELPYKIRRRPDSSGTTRAALGDKTGEVVSRLWFYRAWLQTDSAEPGSTEASAKLDSISAVSRPFEAGWRFTQWVQGPRARERI